MDTLTNQLDILKEALAGYAKAPAGEKSYITQSLDGDVMSVVDVYTFQGHRYADTSLIVSLTGEYIVVERDMNNKPLVDALVQAGIPREQIILAYAGEPVPDNVI